MTTPEIFNDVWQHGHYREGSCAKRMIPEMLKVIPPGATINDYGSGTGRAEVDLLKLGQGFRIHMVDFSPVALEDEARALVDGERLTYTIADLAALPADLTGTVVVTYGDVPLLTSDTLQSLSGGNPAVDGFCYRVACEALSVDVTVPEQQLSESQRNLFKRTLHQGDQ